MVVLGVQMMISLKDYAKNKNVSYEAVRKQVNRYKTELEGHIHKVNRTQYMSFWLLATVTICI